MEAVLQGSRGAMRRTRGAKDIHTAMSLSRIRRAGALAQHQARRGSLRRTAIGQGRPQGACEAGRPPRDIDGENDVLRRHG
jgi:hypothetical protein